MRSRSIITRVVAAVVLLVAGFTAVLVYNAASQRQLIAELAAINDGWVPVLRELDGVQTDLRAFARVLSNGDAVVLRPSLRASLTLFPIPERIEQRCANLDATLATLAVGPRAEDGTAFVVNVRRTVDEVRDAVAESADDAARLLLDIQSDPPLVEPRRSDLLTAVTETEQRVDDLSRLVERRVDVAVASVRDVERRGLQRVAAASTLALVLGFAVVLLILRALRPIQALTLEAARLKLGDYRPPAMVAGDDEVGVLTREFTHMAEAIRDRDARLRRQNDELELAYRQLVVAQRAQVQAERLAAIGEISSQITHELRNPLSSIGLNVEMLSDELRSAESERLEDAADMLRAIERELQRLTDLTDRYLDMASGDGRTRTRCDVASVVTDVVAQLRPECERDGVTLHLEAAPAHCLADADQVRQVVINLVQNALAAVREHVDASRIEVGVGVEDAQVVVSVEDDGPGIADAVADALFEPFTTTRPEGTGLGLAICRRIVEDHGGTIDAGMSERVGGARFEIRLSAAPSDDATTAPPEPHTLQSAG
jgi:two-component system, NtrC family, sensor kinase